MVFSPFQASLADSLIGPPKAGISDSHKARPKDTTQLCPSRLPACPGQWQERILFPLLTEPQPPSPSWPKPLPLPAATMPSLRPPSLPLSLWGNLPSSHHVPQLTGHTSDLVLGVGTHKYLLGGGGRKRPS